MYIPDNRGSVYKSGTHVDSWCIAFDAYDDCPTTAYFLNITYQQLFKGISKAETVTFSWLAALCKHFIGCPRCLLQNRYNGHSLHWDETEYTVSCIPLEST